MIGRQLDNVVKSFSSFGIKEITPRLCDIDNVPLSNPAFNESKARFRRRSTHVPNQIELGSTLERHWRDN